MCLITPERWSVIKRAILRVWLETVTVAVMAGTHSVVVIHDL